MNALGAWPHPSLKAWLADVLEIPAEQDRPLRGLTADSRETVPGGAFLALPGDRSHGLGYLAEVLERGAAAVLWPADAPGSAQAADRCALAGAIGLPVAALDARLGGLVSAYFDHPSAAMAVVGVTGTDGKTSVSHLIAGALEAGGRPAGSIGTLGWGRSGEWHPSTHTTPDLVRVHAALARLRRLGCETVAMEVSSHGLDQGRVDGVRFRLAVLTNLGRDHLDYHGDEASYARAKQRLFEVAGLGAAVLNLDDDFGRRLAGRLADRLQLWTYGADPAARVRLAEVDCHAGGLRLLLHTPLGPARIRSSLLGRFNASNLAAALAALLALELPLVDAIAGLNAIGPIAGRMESFTRPGRPTAVVDYAHTPQALAAALGAAREHCPGRLFCVFGCGGERDRGKRPLMAAAAESGADRVLVTDDNPRSETPASIVADILAGFARPAEVEVVHDRARAIRRALELARAGDLVLVAGKGHETEQLGAGGARRFSDRETVRAWLDGEGAA